MNITFPDNVFLFLQVKPGVETSCFRIGGKVSVGHLKEIEIACINVSGISSEGRFSGNLNICDDVYI